MANDIGKHLALPARFKTFELLHKEGFQHLCTLKEGRVIGVVVAAVVKDFGHVCDKLCELVIMPLLQTGFHCRKVCKVDGEVCKKINKNVKNWTDTKELHHFKWSFRFFPADASQRALLTHWFFDHAVVIGRIMGIHGLEERPCHFVRLVK